MTKAQPTEAAWPLLPSERKWSALRLLIVLTVTAAAPWFFIIGGAIGQYLTLAMGTAAMIAGSLIGIGVVTLAVVPVSSRYAIDSVAAAIPQFGSRGVLLVILLQYLSILGWNATLLVFFGDNVAKLATLVGIEANRGAALVPAATTVAVIVCLPILRHGASGVERICQALVLFVLGVGASLIWLLVSTYPEAIAVARPASASGDPWWDYVTGVEILIATSLSWWAYLGAMTRHVPRASAAILPSLAGLGLTIPLLSIIGLAAALALGHASPSDWLVILGGPAYGAVGLTVIALSNLGTVVAGTYASAIGLKQVPGLGRLGWNALILLSLVPLLVLATAFAGTVRSHFTTFLALIGLGFGPICGIQIADYFALRHQRLSLRGLYERAPDAPYVFWSGVNPAAVLAMAAGCGSYLALLHPLTFASRFPYAWTTASLPAVAVAGAVYWLATRLVVHPAGKGGYPSRAGS
jgi:NCS1 family nucleobase:cation symporter-1